VASTAGTEGPEWSARAAGWAEQWGRFAEPARERLADLTGIGPGTRVLDVGCGSGEMCALAVARGAEAAGLDAAEAMIEITRRRVPSGDLRVGPMESLPWEDDRFDVVTAINALQFAADFVGALAEAARVTRPGGMVAVSNWGPMEDRQLFVVMRALRDGPSAAGSDISEPGGLERLAGRAGLEPRDSGDIEVPYEAPDQEALVRAFLNDARFGALQRLGEDEVRRLILEAAEPFRRADGSYRFENRFRYVIGSPASLPSKPFIPPAPPAAPAPPASSATSPPAAPPDHRRPGRRTPARSPRDRP
jgi:SAM-dependent methyltransferase